MDDTQPPSAGPLYLSDPDLEDFENYRLGGFHPVSIGDPFKDGRYKAVHKLGFGGFSTIWLARDLELNRYVALKMLVARASARSHESTILQYLGLAAEHGHPGARVIPSLLDNFTVEGTNGSHLCLVSEPTEPNVAVSEEEAPDWMFPVESARSIVAQLIMGLSHLHAEGICHGAFLRSAHAQHATGLQNLTMDDLYAQFGSPSTAPVKRRDGAPVVPQAHPEAVYPLFVDMPSNTVLDPKIIIADYGTAFLVSDEKTPQLHTFPHYRPPEIFFGQPPTLAADVWTLGVNLYEVMGERPLFEVFGYNSDDIIAEMVSTLGPLPEPWWSKWQKRPAFFDDKGSWAEDYQGLADPISRPLRQRLWEMGRGESPDTCSWDVAGGEMRALEDMFRGMLTYEPAQRWTSEQLMASEYMTRWALPAWEEQLRREASRLG